MDNKLTVTEVAKILGYNPIYVYSLLSKGVIPNIKLRGRVYVIESELKNWINDNVKKRNTNVKN